MGPFVFEQLDNADKTLSYLLTPNGRLLNKGDNITPVWEWESKTKHSFWERSEPKVDVELVPVSDSEIGNLTDHLGNVRTVITPGSTEGIAAVKQINNYYPFGLKMSLECYSISDNRYMFGGYEFENHFELNWYDSHGRFYMPDLPGFGQPDPYSHKFPYISSYAAFNNNPMRYTDPDGRKIIDSHLTNSQRNKYNTTINSIREINPYFNTLYSFIEQSDINYHIYENRSLNTAGKFIPYSKQSGGKITFRSFNNINQSTAIEEFFHGFQNEVYKDKGPYSKLSEVGSNVEFEAKFLKLMISTNIGGPEGSDDIQMIKKIRYDLIGKYELNGKQKGVYFESLNYFVDYHKKMKDEIEKATGERPKDLYDASPSLQTPNAAFKILEETEKKR